MAATTEELLQMILQSLEKVEYIKSEDIPNIDLYMDQVLTFMDRKLRSAVRPQTEDRILTKTMINNYAKNDLLPPPVKNEEKMSSKPPKPLKSAPPMFGSTPAWPY